MKQALAHFRKTDPVMRGLVRRLGPYAIEYSPPDFATMVRCIVYQQLSGKVASVIYDRLERAAGNGRRLTPAAVIGTPEADLRAVGLSRRKAEFIRDLALACDRGELSLEALEDASDEEVLRTLTARPGIGPWTVHMFLIFGLRRPDVLPTGDLGVRVAVRNVYGLAETPAPAEVARIGSPWRPYASVATWYLWRSLGDGVGL